MLSALMEVEKKRLALHVVVAVTPEMADKELHSQSVPAAAATLPSLPATDYTGLCCWW